MSCVSSWRLDRRSTVQMKTEGTWGVDELDELEEEDSEGEKFGRGRKEEEEERGQG